MFGFRSGLRFSFRALEVPQPRVRKKPFSLTKMTLGPIKKQKWLLNLIFDIVFPCYQLSHWYSRWNWKWKVWQLNHSDQRKLDFYESRNRLLGEEIWVLPGVKYFHLVDKAIRKIVKENVFWEKKDLLFMCTEFFLLIKLCSKFQSVVIVKGIDERKSLMFIFWLSPEFQSNCALQKIGEVRGFLNIQPHLLLLVAAIPNQNPSNFSLNNATKHEQQMLKH